jgi:chaperonin cofactor prefoldin
MQLPRVLITGAMCALLLAPTVTACGGSAISHTISKNRLREMSRRGQLWVFDAENSIIIALDRLDEARDEWYRIKVQLKRASRRISAARKRSRANGVDVAKAYEDYLDDLEDWAKDNIRLYQLGVVVAKAALELAKAEVMQREDLTGDKDFSVKKYQDQYNKLKDAFDKRKKRVRKQRNDARKKEANWRKLRRQYVAQTGDHDSGLWVD